MQNPSSIGLVTSIKEIKMTNMQLNIKKAIE